MTRLKKLNYIMFYPFLNHCLFCRFRLNASGAVGAPGRGRGPGGGVATSAQAYQFESVGGADQTIITSQARSGWVGIGFFLTLFFWSVCYQCLVVLLNGDCVKNKKWLILLIVNVSLLIKSVNYENSFSVLIF